MAGSPGHSKKMPAFTRSNSLHFSPAMPTTTCGSLFSIFRQKRNNTLSSYAQLTPLTKKPTASPPTIYLSASHRPLGPPSHPLVSCGHTLVPAHQPPQHLQAHLALMNHIRIHHNLVDPPPLTSGTTIHYSRTAANNPPQPELSRSYTWPDYQTHLESPKDGRFPNCFHILTHHHCITDPSTSTRSEDTTRSRH